VPIEPFEFGSGLTRVPQLPGVGVDVCLNTVWPPVTPPPAHFETPPLDESFDFTFGALASGTGGVNVAVPDAAPHVGVAAAPLAGLAAMTPTGSINAAAQSKPKYLRIYGPLRQEE
jgi:hypothetical protein